MTKFLRETPIIDFSNKDIQLLSKTLSKNLSSDKDIAKKCFEYVRDEIRHSGDHKDDMITCKASDVLKYKTGWCYAKVIFWRHFCVQTPYHVDSPIRD